MNLDETVPRASGACCEDLFYHSHPTFREHRDRTCRDDAPPSPVRPWAPPTLPRYEGELRQYQPTEPERPVIDPNMVPALQRRATYIPSLLSSTQRFSEARSELRSMMGRSLLIAPGRTSPRCPVIGTLLMRMRARPNPLNCWPCSWSIRTRGNC